jgi:uncharacterized protein YjbI with pentapeptide repeats
LIVCRLSLKEFFYKNQEPDKKLMKMDTVPGGSFQLSGSFIKPMPGAHFDKDLHKMSFRNEDLNQAYFYKSDLRGIDFSGSDLSGAKFIDVRTGIRPLYTFFIFVVALLVGAFCGYIAMLAGRTIQSMLASGDVKIRISALVTLVVILLFIAYSYWKGGLNAILQLIIPIFLFFIVVGGIGYFSQTGMEEDMLYGFLALMVTIIMLVVATIARAMTSKLSIVLFLLVAVMGIALGKSLGGGLGTLILGVSCALFSRRALRGAKGFETLRQIAAFFIVRFGTSFRNCKMDHADFSQSKKICNTDFSHADLSYIQWGESRKLFCVV